MSDRGPVHGDTGVWFGLGGAIQFDLHRAEIDHPTRVNPTPKQKPCACPGGLDGTARCPSRRDLIFRRRGMMSGFAWKADATARILPHVFRRSGESIGGLRGRLLQSRMCRFGASETEDAPPRNDSVSRRPYGLELLCLHDDLGIGSGACVSSMKEGTRHPRCIKVWPLLQTNPFQPFTLQSN
jgi:hypothetical protein